METKVIIETWEDKCGDSYLANGTIEITKDKDYSNLIAIGDIVVSIEELEKAIQIFKV